MLIEYLKINKIPRFNSTDSVNIVFLFFLHLSQKNTKKSKFVLINVAGKSKVKISDDKNTKIIELNKPRMGLFLDTYLWKEMYDFSPDSVLLVLANTHYDGKEYIRNYDEYLDIMKNHK